MVVRINVDNDSVQTVEEIMIDKIYYLSEYEVVIIYTDREPYAVYSSTGNVLELLNDLLTMKEAA